MYAESYEEEMWCSWFCMLLSMLDLVSLMLDIEFDVRYVKYKAELPFKL